MVALFASQGIRVGAERRGRKGVKEKGSQYVGICEGEERGAEKKKKWHKDSKE